MPRPSHTPQREWMTSPFKALSSLESLLRDTHVQHCKTSLEEETCNKGSVLPGMGTDGAKKHFTFFDADFGSLSCVALQVVHRLRSLQEENSSLKKVCLIPKVGAIPAPPIRTHM